MQTRTNLTITIIPRTLVFTLKPPTKKKKKEKKTNTENKSKTSQTSFSAAARPFGRPAGRGAPSAARKKGRDRRGTATTRGPRRTAAAGGAPPGGGGEAWPRRVRARPPPTGVRPSRRGRLSPQ